MGKFLKGVTTGAIIGAVAGAMIIPDLNYGTRKKMQRSKRLVKNAAEDVFFNVKDWIR